MRLRIGLTGATSSQDDAQEGVLTHLLPGAVEHRLAAMLVRIDNRFTFISPARIQQHFVGAVHTDWMSLTQAQAQHFLDLRDKTLRVCIDTQVSFSRIGRPASVTLELGGPQSLSMTHQVIVQGDFQGRLEAYADHFVRYDVSNRPGEQSHGGIMGDLAETLERISL